jgi:hypothetical protein
MSHRMTASPKRSDKVAGFTLRDIGRLADILTRIARWCSLSCGASTLSAGAG